MCVLVGLVLSTTTIWIDRRFDYELVPRSLTGGPDAALQILSTIAASMVSLAALVLTITMVVVQLAMGQFSPRIVQTILQDKPSQFAIGLFVATFVHAMLTLREIGTGDGDVVPGLAIVVSYVLVLMSVAVLVLYVDHTGRALRVSALIELVGTDVRRLLDTTYPPISAAPAGPPPGVVTADHSGVICTVDIERIVELALSRRNAARAFARGGVELGQGHFRVMAVVHGLFLVACAAEVLLLRRPFPGAIGWIALAFALLAQALRYWAVLTLGPKWNARVIVVPGDPPVTAGPYRFVRHPNYVAVVLELLCLPLVHGAWLTAVAFSAANVALLAVRIRAEEAALGPAYAAAFERLPRFVPGGRK